MHIDAAIAVAIVDDHDYGLLVRPSEPLESIVDSFGVALITKERVVITSGIQNGPVVRRADRVVAVRRQIQTVVVRDAVDHHEAAVSRRKWREARRDEPKPDRPAVAA